MLLEPTRIAEACLMYLPLSIDNGCNSSDPHGSPRSRTLLLLLALLCLPASADAATDRMGSGVVTVSNGQTYDNVYGDYIVTDDALSQKGSVAVTGGTIHMKVYGSFAQAPDGTATANNGNVIISGGTLDGSFRNNIYGGYALSTANNALAEGNSVLITGAPSLNSEKYIYGGYAQGNGSAATRVAALLNEVSIQTGTFENVYGGYAGDGSNFKGLLLAAGNNVIITGGSVTNNVYGGRADNSYNSSSVSRADSNRVSIRGGDVAYTVYGGIADSDTDASSDGNTVEISGGNIQFVVGGDAISDSGSATTDNNSVFVSGGNISGTIIGGSADNGGGGLSSSSYNTVIVENASVGSYVSGGLAQITQGGAVASHNNVLLGQGASVTGDVHGGDTTGGSGTADYNIVSLYGGASVSGSLYGGRAETDGSASHNVLLITNGTTTGDLYGGDGGTGGEATGNSVILGEAAKLNSAASIYGGAAGSGNAVPARSSGNTLFLDSWQGTVQRSAGFEYYHFVLPSPGADATIPMLTLSSAQQGDFDGASVTVQLPDITTGGRASPGQTFTLIRDDSGAVNELSIGSSSLTLPQGLAALFDCRLFSHGNSISFDIVNFRPNPQIKALNEAQAAATAALNTGTDLIAGEGMRQAAEAAKSSGWAGFAAIYGDDTRYHTGSHVDVKGISLLTGVSTGSSGIYTDATLGMFFELGYSTLDTFNEFERGNVSGGGRSRYLGGGLLGRLDISHAPFRGMYAEASVRAGKLETSWNSDDLRDNMDRKADFDSSTPYYGFHVGLGSLLHLTDSLRADIHAKYFWTRQEGQTLNILGDVFDFDAVDSQRLRLGARLEYDLAEKLTPYIGAAWEHEFDGTARSSVPYYGLDIASVSTKGDSGIFEAGLNIRPADIPANLSLGLRGSVGAREGFGGHLNAVFTF